jgi:hypothetical protein
MSNTRWQLNGELHNEFQTNSNVNTGNMDEMFTKAKAERNKQWDL